MAWGVLLAGLSTFSAQAQDQNDDAPKPNEYRVKAEFLVNFARFVEWPESSFPSPDSPMSIGFIGEGFPESDLQAHFRGRKIGERDILLLHFKDVSQLAPTHVLLVSETEAPNASAILEQLKGKPTLVVGNQIPDFCETGGMINFIQEKVRTRFEINQAAAEESGLKISARLLGQAVRVTTVASNPPPGKRVD